MSDAVSSKEKNVVGKAAFGIINRALTAPVQSIVANSGEHWSKIETELSRRSMPSDSWKGFNALNNQMGDLKTAGIVDPLKVVKTAFLNAVSVAANYLTVGAAIANIPEKKEKLGGGMPMGEDY